MSAPSTMADLVTTANSNPTSGTDNANTIDESIRGTQAILRGLSFKGSDIASASSLSLGSAFGSLFKVTGTTTVTGISSTNSWAGRVVTFWLTGTQQWTHGSTLFFPDLTTRKYTSGDLLTFVDTDGAGTWYCIGVHRASSSLPVTSTATTAALADRGAVNFLTAGITVPANTFAAGDELVFYNNSASSITVTQGSSLTLRLAGTTSTGNRTLGARGLCTVIFVSTTEAVASGSGLS